MLDTFLIFSPFFFSYFVLWFCVKCCISFFLFFLCFFFGLFARLATVSRVWLGLNWVRACWGFARVDSSTCAPSTRQKKSLYICSYWYANLNWTNLKCFGLEVPSHRIASRWFEFEFCLTSFERCHFCIIIRKVFRALAQKINLEQIGSDIFNAEQ